MKEVRFGVNFCGQQNCSYGLVQLVIEPLMGVSQPQMRNLFRELLLALIKKVKSECFATLKASVTEGKLACPLVAYREKTMDSIKLYEISNDYIDYLSLYATHLFRNKKPEQKNERKYIGIILQINNVDYFAPLSSFKQKHKAMGEMLDFIKVKDYAVINLNNMFPVPASEYTYVDFAQEKDLRYRSLLLSEYRYIKSIQKKIRKNALVVYKHKIENGNSTKLAKRCNDFVLLEELCKNYKR